MCRLSRECRRLQGSNEEIAKTLSLKVELEAAAAAAAAAAATELSSKVAAYEAEAMGREQQLQQLNDKCKTLEGKP